MHHGLHAELRAQPSGVPLSLYLIREVSISLVYLLCRVLLEAGPELPDKPPVPSFHLSTGVLGLHATSAFVVL